MEADSVWTAYLCMWLAVIGAVLGSFLDCAADRWSRGEDWRKGRSHCTSCGHVLGPGDLFPIFSYVLHGGRCRYCGSRIPGECLYAELAGATAFVCLGLRFGLSPELGQWLVFAGILLALSLADRKRRIIPDPLVLLLILNRAVWIFLLHQSPAEIVRTILPGLGIPICLLVFVLWTEKLQNREVMGGGDIKLLFALALCLTWAEQLFTLLTGCLMGLLAVFCSRRQEKAVPFGPFLSAGAVLALTLGSPLIQWYLALF